MKNILNKVKYSLNNEVAGPNLETMFGIGVSLGVMGAILGFARAAYSWVYQASKIVECYD